MIYIFSIIVIAIVVLIFIFIEISKENLYLSFPYYKSIISSEIDKDLLIKAYELNSKIKICNYNVLKLEEELISIDEDLINSDQQLINIFDKLIKYLELQKKEKDIDYDIDPGKILMSFFIFMIIIRYFNTFPAEFIVKK